MTSKVTIRRSRSPELVKPNPPNLQAAYAGLRELNLERAVKSVGTPQAVGYLQRAAVAAAAAGDADGAAELRHWADAAREGAK